MNKFNKLFKILRNQTRFNRFIKILIKIITTNKNIKFN